MNSFSLKFLLLLIVSIVFSGCSRIIEQAVYVQDIHVYGPLQTPPMAIIDTLSIGNIVISPKLFINPSNSFKGNIYHSKVNSEGIYKLDTLHENGIINYKESESNDLDYTGDNFNWTIPAYSGALDVQLPLNNRANLNLGISYTSYKYYDLMGGSIGFSFFKYTENLSTSLSIGIHAQEMYYEASSVVKTTIQTLWSGEKHTDIFLYQDASKDFAVNFYATFMLNYFYKEQGLGFNFPFSFFTQTTFDFEPNTYNRYYHLTQPLNSDYNAKVSHFGSFVSISPGLYTYIAEKTRLAANFNIVYELGKLGSDNKGTMLFPVLKLDFLF